MKGITEEEFLLLEEEARRSCSSERDKYLETFTQPDFSLPTDDPLLWDMEEYAKAEAMASLFSSEYVFDWNPVNALMRMGAEYDEARRLSKSYMKNPLVLRFIRRRKQRFLSQNVVSAEHALSLISQDAADFSPFANPIARTKAQQAYWQAVIDIRKMELEERKMELAEQEEQLRRRAGGGSGTGGVLVVPGLMQGDSWEEMASEAQDALHA